jgi:hypothetical protein
MQCTSARVEFSVEGFCFSKISFFELNIHGERLILAKIFRTTMTRNETTHSNLEMGRQACTWHRNSKRVH